MKWRPMFQTGFSSLLFHSLISTGLPTAEKYILFHCYSVLVAVNQLFIPKHIYAFVIIYYFYFS